jgi:hypothetical protein
MRVLRDALEETRALPRIHSGRFEKGTVRRERQQYLNDVRIYNASMREKIDMAMRMRQRLLVVSEAFSNNPANRLQ